MRRRNPRRTPRAAITRPSQKAPAPAEQPTSWYRIENLVEKPGAAIWIYEEIGYWGVEASDFVRDLQTVAGLDLEVHINSPGGDVFDGLAIYNALKQHAERATVTVRIDGLAASAASFIAMAGDTVKIARNAQLMIHDASGFCYGNAVEMQAMADLLAKISDNIADIYAVKAGGTVEQWRDAMKAETWYTGTEAVEAGLCDEIDSATALPEAPEEEPEGEPEESLATARWDLSVFTYAGRAQAPPPILPRPVAAAEASEASAVPPGPAEEEVVAASESGEGSEAAAAEPAAEETVEEQPAEAEETPADPHEPEGEPSSAEAAAPDAWANLTAGLVATDDWAAMTAGLLTPARDAWADLTEALL